MNPEPEIMNAGNYLVLGNFLLTWNYYCSNTDEIPEPIHGITYVILKKIDLCQCSSTAGSWYLEANLAYCRQEPTNELTLYYTVNMATILYQFQEKLKKDRITDQTMFINKIGFGAEEPNLIVETDSAVVEETSPAVDYKEVIQDYESKRYLSKPDLAMPITDATHWLDGHKSLLTSVDISAIMVITLILFIMFTLYKYCGVKFQFQKISTILAKPLVLNKTSETIQPALADPMKDKDSDGITIQMLDLKLIQITLIVMLLTFTCYLLFRLTLWMYDYLNNKYVHINSTGLTYLKTLTLDKTNIYLHLYDFTTSYTVDLYLRTIFGNPEDLDCEGQFFAGRISLDHQSSYDYIDLKWNTIFLSLKNLDLPNASNPPNS